MAAADQDARHAIRLLADQDETFARELGRRTDPETSSIGVLDWDSCTAPGVVRAMMDLDCAHLDRLRRILREHGWPGRHLVGEDGAHAAWLLVLHADRDRAFQRRCVRLLRRAVAAGDADPRQAAWLTDRLLLASGKYQHFGTIVIQKDGEPVPFRLANPEAVDRRRRRVGLTPLREELQRQRRGKPRQDFPSPGAEQRP